MGFAAAFCMLRYSLIDTETVFELGPEFMYLIGKQRYHSQPGNETPLDGMDKFNSCDVGLRMGVLFRHGRHFQWGIGSYIGFLDMFKDYPEQNRHGTIYCRDVTACVGWRF